MNKNLSIEIGEISNDSAYQIVKFIGDFDKAGYNEIHDNLDAFVKSFDGKNLIFDFTNLKFINSEGIGYLMEIHAHLVKQEKKLIILNVNAHVGDIFKTIGIYEIVPIYQSLEEFLKNKK